MDTQPKSKLSRWLDNLQQESWQLELVISGFAIFLLLATFKPYYDLQDEIEYLGANSRTYQILLIPYGIGLAAWFALVVNLIIHVLLRGLWISTVGLRYVSQDIDFEQLKLRPRFEKFLRRRIISFDRYIESLEKYCSVIFAFTFLIIFMLISVGMFIAFVGVLDSLLLDPLQDKWPKVGEVIKDQIVVVFFIGGLIYFFDFITLGWIKRRKWITRIYFPIYRFYSWISLAFLYRPIYYNLIDNKFGRKIGLLLFPYVLLGMLVSSVRVVTHQYLPLDPGKRKLSVNLYDDTRPERTFTYFASIPSKYVDNGFLELFLPYNPDTDDKAIAAICPDIEPGRFTGVKLRKVIQAGQIYNEKSNADTLLSCLSQMHRIYINDSLYSNLALQYYDHPIRKNKGLITILDVNYLDRGKHLLRVETQFYSGRADSLRWSESAYIPFWKE